MIIQEIQFWDMTREKEKDKFCVGSGTENCKY